VTARGRPRNPNPRSARLVVNLTPAELATVREWAQRDGLAPSVWARARLLGTAFLYVPPGPTPPDVIERLRQDVDALLVDAGEESDRLAFDDRVPGAAQVPHNFEEVNRGE
jgi:hypothetical protein